VLFRSSITAGNYNYDQTQPRDLQDKRLWQVDKEGGAHHWREASP